MINSILETRSSNGENHHIVLEIPENEFFQVYSDADQESALDVLNLHLENRGDDGRVHNIGIDHDKPEHIIRVKADLSYTGNEHTDYRFYFGNTFDE